MVFEFPADDYVDEAGNVTENSTAGRNCEFLCPDVSFAVGTRSSVRQETEEINPVTEFDDWH